MPKTIEESVIFILERFDKEEAAAMQSLKELYGEPRLLRLAMVLADSTASLNSKMLHALVIGIMIGMEAEK